MAGRGSSQSEVRKVLRECRKQGLLVREGKDGQGHWVVSDPGGRVEVRVSFSPGSSRSLNNTIALLRRELGFVWKGHASKAAPRYVDRTQDQEEEIEDVSPGPVHGSHQERGQVRHRHAKTRRR